MGDDGENSGEQIRSVEEQIRSVEEQIRSVEEQIRSVEEQIRRVEELIDSCPDGEERKLLRGKEAQLRGEKEQLRGKEAQLRGEKALVLQGRDKCTEFDWLRQDLPSLDSGSAKLPSATQKERMYTPVRVEYWDVAKDIQDYLNKADKLKRIYQKVDTTVFATGKLHLQFIASSILHSTCEFFSKKLPGSLVTLGGEVNLKVPPEFAAEEGNLTNSDGSEAEDRDYQKVLFYARPPRVDVLVHCNGMGVIAVEVKNGGLGCPVPLYKLWARCSCPTGNIDLNCWCHTDISKGHARSILNCILQVYEYLAVAKVGYGVLTDIQNWYLCKRDHGGCLYISTGFRLEDRQPPLLAAIAYLVNFAVDGRGKFDVSPKKGERPWSWETTPCTSPSDDSKDDEDKDITYEPNERETGGYRTSPVWTRRGCSNTRQNQLQEFPASDLHLDDRPITSEGWSGCVVGGTLNGCRVAVKLAFRNSERAEALLNEVDAYRKLQKYWGEFVPPLVGFGTTANGQIVFIATELIDGSPLGPGTVTKEVTTAALKGLDAIHECKLLHGDVEARNIMVVRGTEPSVRFVDFGFAKRSNNRKSQMEERERLEDLLHDMMGIRVGKAFDGIRYPRMRLCAVCVTTFSSDSDEGDSSLSSSRNANLLGV